MQVVIIMPGWASRFRSTVSSHTCISFLFMAEWNSLATSCEELTHWKRPWCREGLGAGGEGDNRGWDGWMASLTRWTWVWMNSGSGWWTGRPGVPRFMGSQRVRHDWTTELNWTELNILFSVCVYIHHIFLNQSSVDGHFSYFHVFSVVNSAAVNIGVDLPFQIRVLSFLDICSGVGLVDHPVALFLVFWETSTLHHTFP